MRTRRGAVPGLALAAMVGCAPAHDTQPEPSTNGVAVERQQDAHEPDRLVALVSLDAAEEDSSRGVALDLRIDNERAVAARTQLRVQIGSEHESRTVLIEGPALPASGSADIHVPEEQLALSDAELTFSGQLRIEALVSYADQEQAQSSAVFRYFHAAAGLWHSYDQATRDRLHEGGALSAELRGLRRAALAGAPAANDVVFAGPARGTDVSSDPNFVPQLEEGESNE